jgi:predicted transcriptional regulator
MSSGSVVAGTLAKPLVKTEEIGYRRVTEIFPHEHPQFKILENEIADVKKSIDQLDSKVEELCGYLPKVVVIEEIPKEEAKKRVEEYFKKHGQADIEELMMNLKIPVQTLVEILDELKREGKITAQDDEVT